MARARQPAKPKRVGVLIEMSVQRGAPAATALQMAGAIKIGEFEIDPGFEPVPLGPTPEQAASLAAAGEEVIIVRGLVDEDKLGDLETQPNVIKVWRDTPIAPFVVPTVKEATAHLMSTAPTGLCPIPPCDCTFGNPAIGTSAGVASYLGVDRIHTAGFRGTGIVIGIVDGGITAIGRPVSPGEIARIPRVIGGYPTADWGTTAAAWGEHGNMTAWDAFAMAPDAQIYDIRISAAGTASTIAAALAGFQWAINQHRSNGTPHILSNSWGIFQESWDPVYARDPNHPFTRKVVEALDEGIIVLFAAGNCGQACPDGRCGPDNGPGQSIWGANGHPRVITVGAVNLNEHWVGYSSQGPATLDPNKPDFCSITHFAGYFPTLNPAHASDGGTSAATPIAAGVIALFKQAKPGLTQDEAKTALKDTAKDIGPAGWDQHSGAGIIQAKAAFDSIRKPEEEGICIIATAAYGSPIAPEVQFLRELRDNVLRRTRWGYKFFEDYWRYYYQFSPEIAAQMNRDPELKKVIRWSIVTPIINYLKLLVKRPRKWDLDKVEPELKEFLNEMKKDMDAWVDIIEVPESFEGLDNKFIIDELNIALDLILKGTEKADGYLDRLIINGVLPLRYDSDEEVKLLDMLVGSGRSISEINKILYGKPGNFPAENRIKDLKLGKY